MRLRIATRPTQAVSTPETLPSDPPSREAVPPASKATADPDRPAPPRTEPETPARPEASVVPPPTVRPPPLLLADSRLDSLPTRPVSPPSPAEAGPVSSPAAPTSARLRREGQEPAPPVDDGRRPPEPDSPATSRPESEHPDARPTVDPVATSDAAPTRPAEPTMEIRPRYPRSSIRRGREGLAVVAARVGADGGVRSVRLVRSSGHARLDAAALSAVREARFRPALRNGEAVASVVHVPIRFRLR